MAQCTVRAVTVFGLEVLPVDVEVDVGAGLPSFAIVGLPDLAVQEARERVRSAVRASGFDVPNSRIVVNLAPGPVRKHGTGFDLSIALGLLIATGQVAPSVIEGCVVVGELSLDGSVRGVPGMLAYARAARDARRALLGPVGPGTTGHLDGLECRPITHLGQSRSLTQVTGSTQRNPRLPSARERSDFGDIAGHEQAKRALLIAAAGGHNVLMVGPPGSGKTMLARRLPSILPPLDDQERLETAVIHSIAGLEESDALEGVRPFRAPHHSASIAGLVGGGSPARPGEASLAHNGVLFLDEMPEFGPASLQALRQPLEDGVVTLVRVEGRMRFPSRFSLVGAANPCPCGFRGDRARPCTCTPGVAARYLSRIGGPLIDRIDLVFDVDRVDPSLLLRESRSTSSAEMRTHVLESRARAAVRGLGPTALLQGAALLKVCRLDGAGARQLEAAARFKHLSGRGVTRLLRVARTIADLDRSERVMVDHISEALGFRAKEEG